MRIPATVNIIPAMNKSIIFHDSGLFNIGERRWAPYPNEKKNTKDAVAAPIPNISFSSPT
ncbi:uncharacterized protein METZ01_LOCUS296775 [marine metagenome]|uniref:Uncharacterized protein n=1 Tax=marine metagenome TaxID=408172 RepID=A0A382M9N3_9ZZZZ